MACPPRRRATWRCSTHGSGRSGKSPEARTERSTTLTLPTRPSAWRSGGPGKPGSWRRVAEMDERSELASLLPSVYDLTRWLQQEMDHPETQEHVRRALVIVTAHIAERYWAEWDPPAGKQADTGREAG